MLDTLSLIYIIVPIGFCLLCIVASCIFAHVFVLDRRKPPQFLVSVRYMPPKVKRKIEVIDFKSPLKKRDKRKQRLKEIRSAMRIRPTTPFDAEAGLGTLDTKANNTEDQRQFTDNDEEAAEDDNNDDNEESNKNTNNEDFISFTRFSSSFFRASFFNFTGSFLLPNVSVSSKSQKKTMRSSKTKKSVSSSFSLQSSSFSPSSRQPLDVMSPSGKSRRFVSQDRINRSEARKQLLRASMPNFIEHIHDIDNSRGQDGIISILDVEDMEEEKRQTLITQRRKHRETTRQEAIARGEMDIVAMNSGPTVDKIPAGYRMIEFLPDLASKRLIYQRVLYLWQEPKKPQGWFIATIVSESKMPGCNFTLKYDRAETGTLFIDGAHPVQLSFEGESAYGRKWVLIERIDGQGRKLNSNTNNPNNTNSSSA